MNEEMTFSPNMPAESSNGKPYTVTTPASGSAYTAVRRQALIVSGGTVSLLTFSSMGVSVSLPNIEGMYELYPGDSITFTYLVAPTLTVIPR